jgi:hypothetical protein
MEHPEQTPEVNERAADDLDEELGRLEREGEEGDESEELEDRGDV